MGSDEKLSAFGWGLSGLIANMDDLAALISEWPWSPIGWSRGYRRSDNFEGAMYMALDFDGELSLANALKIFCDCQHVIGTTRNHQKSKNGLPPVDRFRVVVPFDQGIVNPKIFSATMWHCIAKYDADAACKDLGRWYHPCTEIISVSNEGYTQELVLPKAQQPRSPTESRHRRDGTIRLRTVYCLEQPFPQGERNQLCFMCAKDILDSGEEPEEVFEMIMSSPAQTKNPNPLSEREVWLCIKSAVKSIETGKAYGRHD
jgi:hypothetical protein